MATPTILLRISARARAANLLICVISVFILYSDSSHGSANEAAHNMCKLRYVIIYKDALIDLRSKI